MASSDYGMGAILLLCLDTLAYGISTFLEVVTKAEYVLPLTTRLSHIKLL